MPATGDVRVFDNELDDCVRCLSDLQSGWKVLPDSYIQLVGELMYLHVFHNQRRYRFDFQNTTLSF